MWLLSDTTDSCFTYIILFFSKYNMCSEGSEKQSSGVRGGDSGGALQLNENRRYLMKVVFINFFKNTFLKVCCNRCEQFHRCCEQTESTRRICKDNPKNKSLDKIDCLKCTGLQMLSISMLLTSLCIYNLRLKYIYCKL